MQITRRGFIAGTGSAIAGTFVGMFASPEKSYSWEMIPWRLQNVKENTTICCYCGVGCSIIAHYREYEENGETRKEIINLEGDPEHPINEGSLCSKGGALYQLANNPPITKDGEVVKKHGNRLSKVEYRAPNSTEFVEKDWDWAITEIAKRVKESRDRTFIEKDEEGRIVNRTMGIASLGGAALDNEECYLLVKMMRQFGLVYIEHQARI